MEDKKAYENGIYAISNDNYHNSLGVSRSALMEFKRSPFHYWHKYLSGNHDNLDITSSMDFGNLLHTLILEPNKFDEEFVIQPILDRRTKAGKHDFNVFTAHLMGRRPIKIEDYEKALLIQQEVLKNELAKSLIDGGMVEQSIYFTHERTGIQCKVRPDVWNGQIVVDLKTTVDASYRAFQGSAFKYGYYLQAGMISEALKSIDIKLEQYVIFAVEKEPPFALAIYLLDEEAISFGINQFNNLLETFARCQQNDKWPSFGLQTLTIPGYANFEIETEYEHE